MGEVKEDGEEEVDVHDCVGGRGGGSGGGDVRGGELEMVRVLVVDDSPVDRRIVEMLLKRSGGIFDVVSVDSGKKAMEVLGLTEIVAKPCKNYGNVLQDQKIDIVLTDYCMPEMTGFDLLKAVKKHNTSRSIPVVVMSSENNPERISRCRAIGAEDFILKPLQVTDVQRLTACTLPIAPNPMLKSGSKRKQAVELMVESIGSDARPRLAKVAAALALLFLILNYF
ncbi:two-component response regulator ORR1 [Canna indica]|uniref:Two-component response regulator ORR1 n=1 Tax=Canna indica TaxID=4628 RepID=A0AAQ3Q3J6_9LILI|nr:two-component response regulator ORR1 [Canna indica]